MSTSATPASSPKGAPHKATSHRDAPAKDATPAAPPQASEGTTAADTVRLRGDALVARIRELIHESTVRRIVVKNDEGHTVLEIPVAAGVVAAVAAPIVTAVSAIAALANDWKIEVYRKEQ
ncbi:MULTISPECIES: DUF4342 domain-containing protein [unclassified Pseudonocardia]|jgi:hypothetical protein|uniref:DUF4342 domain-containing protein n=1 Tax=unclassified Pseudonocardia TaxID=2619320 RepID=UPI001AD4112D|nr:MULTISPECIES: DUF4342 domain-containing protein [unclassified Pseudonocardia]MBN9096774.1 DUF4342 domain-containing protein [Pseudonocardia sp.]